MRRLALLLVLAPLAAARPAAADTCTPSRALVVLDKSSSMITGDIAGTPKWDVAVAALDTISGIYEGSIELGLMMFPDPDQCSPGSVQVPLALGNHDAIVAAMSEPPPAAGNWTPMSQTLDAAGNEPALLDASRQRSVVLVTDGWQWCSPYDPATRLDPVTSVTNLHARGVTVYVVGFGDNVDAFALNQMAVEAGTALAGCDPTGDAPDAPNPCYYRADEPGELVTALDGIALHISAEVCDGVDNDCDGAVDEDVTRECASACGTGVETCAAGVWMGCTAPPVSAEVCDGLDNDCDGTTDPGCSCLGGDTRPCGDTDEGACSTGSQTCGPDGTWSACVGAVGPSDESCDGADNDCDGEVDETGPAGDLCPGAQVCLHGACVDTQPETPVSGEDDSGCACRTAPGAPGAGSALAGVLFAALAIAFVRRGNRK